MLNVRRVRKGEDLCQQVGDRSRSGAGKEASSYPIYFKILKFEIFIWTPMGPQKPYENTQNGKHWDSHLQALEKLTETLKQKSAKRPPRRMRDIAHAPTPNPPPAQFYTSSTPQVKRQALSKRSAGEWAGANGQRVGGASAPRPTPSCTRGGGGSPSTPPPTVFVDLWPPF